MQKPLIKGIYRHYKGNLYQVIDVARHCDSEEVLVVYRALYSDYGLWLRPVADFCAQVETAAGRQPRFVLETALESY